MIIPPAMKNLAKTILFPAILLYGCSHYYYVANVQNVPLLGEKNEYRLSGTYGIGDESQSIEVQGAYSITDKVGMIADFMTAWGGDVSDKDYGKGTYFDGAIGYYKAVTRSGVFEFYGGLGGSSQHHEYTGLHYISSSGTFSSEYNGSSNISFLKLFIQPSFGLTFSIFEIAVSARLSRLSYINVSNNVLGNTYLFNEVNSLSNNGHFFIEPAGTLRIGCENIKVQLQALYAGYLNKHESDIGEEVHLSAGLFFTIAGAPR